MENFSFSILKKFLTVGFFIGLASILIGMIFFFSQWNYSETGHQVLLLVFIVLSFILMFTVHFNRANASGLIILCLFLILGYAFAKFEWRKEYILAAQNGNFPAINQHIKKYPTYEEHKFSSFMNSPRWISFSRECFEPALYERPMAENCHSANLIQDHYSININDTINTHYAKMRKTAFMLQKGQLNNQNIYRSCLQSKNCAFIPLLPADANIENISPKSDTHLRVRRQFWSIINNKNIQPEVCEFMDLCRVMNNANVVSIKESPE